LSAVGYPSGLTDAKKFPAVVAALEFVDEGILEDACKDCSGQAL
jgi:hypothetical protein